MNVRFDIARDNELIAAGTHFWCGGYLCAVPIERRSKNPLYCVDCLMIIEREAHRRDPDRWQGDKFIVGGKEFNASYGQTS